MYLLAYDKENYVFYSIYLSEISLNVCHSSAFQTISVRSDYIKIMNNSDSTLANLNNIQSKRNNMQQQKPHSYQILQYLIVTIFFSGGILKNLQFFMNSISWDFVIYIFIFICAVFVSNI